MTFVRAFDRGAATPTSDAYSKTFFIGAAVCLVAAGVAWLLIEEGEVGAAALLMSEESSA